MPVTTVPPESDADQADLHDQAVALVEHARRKYPWLRAIDPVVHINIVESWLQPLSVDRPWARRQLEARRGQPAWVEGYGLHVPRQLRGAA